MYDNMHRNYDNQYQDRYNTVPHGMHDGPGGYDEHDEYGVDPELFDGENQQC